MSIIKTGTGATLVRTGAVAALALAAVVGVAGSSQAAVAVMTLSAVTGPSAGGNTITLTIPSTASPKFVSGSVGVQFQNTATPATSACATNPATNAAATAITATSMRFLSTTKVSIAVPNLSTGTLGTWIVCAYNATGSSGTISGSATMIGKGAYTVASAPTITSISPTNGPALGGQTVTFTGTNFPAAITATTPLTATVGGVALLSVTAIDTTHFSAVTPPKAAGSAVAVSATTNGGTVTSASAYTFKNGIVISPNTVVSGQSVDVDVQGVGFNSITFGDTAGTDSGDGTAAGTNDADGHVYLVAGAYNQASYAAGANKTKGQAAECINVAVISDTELICTVDAGSSIDSTTAAGTYTYSGTNLADGTYTLTVVDDGSATAPTYKTVLSSGATFTVSDF